MSALTHDELLRFRRKIGDVGEPPAYSDPELQDLYQESGSEFNRAVMLAFEELLGNAWRFNDYTQNESQEKKQQIFENLRKLHAMWENKLSKKKQVSIVGARSIPPRRKDKPVEYGDDDIYTPRDFHERC